MSTGSGHPYNEYRSYGSGSVANFFPDATHSTRPVRAIARAQTRTPRGSHAAEQLARPKRALGRRQSGAVEYLRRLAALRRTAAHVQRPLS